MEMLTAWCDENDLFLIEDCAQAIGAEIKNKKVGTFGDIGTFSFYPTKNLGTIGDAGALCTNNVQLAETLTIRRQYGWRSRYLSYESGSNLRMDEVHAFVLRTQLDKLEKYNSRRRDIWNAYQKVLLEFDKSDLLLGKNTPEFVAHLCVLKVKNRTKLQSFFNQYGLSTDVHYPHPDYLQPAFAKFKNRSLPNTEELCREVLTIPLFETMTSDEVSHTCNTLLDACIGNVLF